MNEIIQVRLRETGKVSYYLTGGLPLVIGDYVIVEEDRSLEYGQVMSDIEKVVDANLTDPLKQIVRKAAQGDIHQIEKNRKKIKEVISTCQRKIIEHRLPMKLVDAEFSFDRSKILFYFTSEGRVDFRELVKDLARIFKARIELKQIGVRDEAKILGGIGPCGMNLCCASFLKDFEPVTIKMAKDQNMPLNPNKISGLCGRLMCCLSYEHEVYKELLKNLPKVGQHVKTHNGLGKVIEVTPLKRAIRVELEDGRQIEIFYDEKGQQIVADKKHE